MNLKASAQIWGWDNKHDSRFADAAARDRAQNNEEELEFGQKLNLAAAVLGVAFVREMDLGAAAKTAFRGKSERRSVQHRMAGNDSFKRDRLH